MPDRTGEPGQNHLARLGAGAALVWRVLLLAVPVTVVLFAVFVVTAARSNSLALDWNAASAVGDRATIAVDAYVAHLVEDARIIAGMPAVRDVAMAAPDRLDPAQAKALDEAWIRRRKIPTPTEVQPVIDEILGRPVSRYFSELCSTKTGAVREMLLTDRTGRLVAASGATENYDQRNEDWWTQGFRKTGSCQRLRDCAYASDVKMDHSVGARAFDLSVPVLDDSGKATGVLKLVLDPRDIRALLALAAGNHPVHVALIRRENGAEVLDDRSPLANLEGNVPPDILDDLARIGPDQQISIVVDGVNSPVRALSGPHAETWAVAVLDRTERAHRASLQILALVAIIVAMFLLSVRAYALLLRGFRSSS